MSERKLLLLIPMKIVEDVRLNSAQMILYSLIFQAAKATMMVIIANLKIVIFQGS